VLSDISAPPTRSEKVCLGNRHQAHRATRARLTNRLDWSGRPFCLGFHRQIPGDWPVPPTRGRFLGFRTKKSHGSCTEGRSRWCPGPVTVRDHEGLRLDWPYLDVLANSSREIRARASDGGSWGSLGGLSTKMLPTLSDPVLRHPPFFMRTILCPGWSGAPLGKARQHQSLSGGETLPPACPWTQAGLCKNRALAKPRNHSEFSQRFANSLVFCRDFYRFQLWVIP